MQSVLSTPPAEASLCWSSAEQNTHPALKDRFPEMSVAFYLSEFGGIWFGVGLALTRCFDFPRMVCDVLIL